MASNPLTFTLTPGMAPAAPLMRLLSQFDREKVEAFAEISVAFLDLIDSDPDLEDDDPSGQCDEDGINTDLSLAECGGPACALADPPEDDDNDHEHDGREEELGVI